MDYIYLGLLLPLFLIVSRPGHKKRVLITITGLQMAALKAQHGGTQSQQVATLK